MELLNNKKYAIPIVGVFIFFALYKPAGCFILLGTLVTTICIHYWLFLREIDKNGIKIIGKILFYKSDSEGHKTPIVEFTSKGGVQIQKEPYCYASTDLSIFKTYSNNINKPVSILYDSKNPEKFILEKERGFNNFSLIFGALVGLIFLTIGICCILGIINIEF